MESPMASGPEPPNPVLRESHVANTVSTSTKVMNSSMPKTCPHENPVPGFGVHTTSAVLDGVRPLRMPAPAMAPTDCTTMYRKALQTKNTSPVEKPR